MDGVEDERVVSIRNNKMKKQYTKKQITEAIAYWQKRLNESEQLNEGWLGGLLGAVAAGIVGGIGFPSLVLLGCSIYGGHKIQQYFEKRSAAGNLNDQELALLAALQEAGVSGIATRDIQVVAKKAKADVKDTIDLLDNIVSLDLASWKNGKYLINVKGKNILKDAGYKPYAVKKDAESFEQNEKLSEARHDGTWLPKYPTHRNSTEKPTVYYLGVDDSDDFRGYGSYIMPNGSLTRGASNSDFKSAAVTKVPASLRGMIDKAVAKYGSNKYIFIFKEEYSYGNWTHKSHARPSVIDIWYPNGQYWRRGLAEVNALQENDMLKGKPHNNHI